MSRNHLKRIAAPRTWPIERKKTKFVAKPIPGPHSMRDSMPLGLVLKEILHYFDNTNEVRFALNNNEVLIDKVVRKKYKFPVGLMDVLELPKLNDIYRILYTKTGRLYFVKIDNKESNLKLLKIIGKKTLKKNKIQINLNDGRNILVPKDSYKVGDSLLFDLESKKIKDHFKLDKGSVVFLIGGRHIGTICKIKSVDKKKSLQKQKIICESDGKTLETLQDYAFVVGKDKPVIKIK